MVQQILKARLNAVFANPPILVVSRVLSRLGIDSPYVQRREFANLVAQGEPGRVEAIFRRLCREAVVAGVDPDTAFSGKNVVEIGCGRYGGLAPFMMCAGAACYIGVDPVARADIAQSQTALSALEASYFRRAGLDSQGLLDRYAARCTFRDASDFAGQTETGSVDAVVSISCLEHIGNLDAAINIHTATLRSGGFHLHLVNFSNHLDKRQPFRWMYELSPEAYRESFGNHINLKRTSDMAAIFRNAGLETTVMPLDVRLDDVPTDTLDPWWRKTYEMDELGIRTAAIYAVKTTA